MTHKIIFAIVGSLLLSLLTLVGCTADIDSPTPPEANGNRNSFLKLEINVADTRADLDATTFAEGDSIFVVVVDSENPDLYRTSKAVYDGQTWALETPVNLAAVYEDGTKWSDNVKILAFYPYGLGENYDNEKQGCEIPSSSRFINSDILYGNTLGINSGNPSAKITFQHAMSRITLNVKNPTDETIVVDRAFINNDDNTLYLKSPAFISAYSGITATTILLSKAIEGHFLVEPHGETNINFLLSPTEGNTTDGILQSKLLLTKQTTSETFSIYFELNMPLWLPGQQYTYPITLKYDSKEELTGEINGHEYVDLGLSVLWATCNIGAETPEDYGLYFQWGDIIGHVREGDAIADGYVFDDSWYIYNMTLEQMLEQGIVEYDKVYNDQEWFKLTPAYDAATQNWGDGWRMPTYDEINELYEKTIINELLQIQSDVKGYENGHIMLPYEAYVFNENGLQKNIFSQIVSAYLGTNIAKIYYTHTTGFSLDTYYLTLCESPNPPGLRMNGLINAYFYWGTPIRPVADRPTK